MSRRANVIRHGANHTPGGSDPIPGLITEASRVDTFYDSVLTLAATSDLRGYWRLGEGGFGPYADSKGTSSWANTPMARVNNTVDMTDLSAGALTVDDDGAVQFNSSTGSISSDRLEAPNVWGTSTSNPFNAGLSLGLTVAGWVKPFASASTFDGGVFSMAAFSSHQIGYALGVAWPTRQVFFVSQTTRLTGPALVADEWVFAVAVYDAVSIRIYLNGALVATGASVAPGGANNSNPTIGLWNSSAGASVGAGVLYGAVDEVSVWGAALTSDEITLLWASGVSDGTGGSGGVVVDSFSKLGDALLTGDVTVSAGANVTLTQTGQNVEIAAATDVDDPADDTEVWMPLVDSDGACVLDDTGALIPTLIPL